MSEGGIMLVKGTENAIKSVGTQLFFPCGIARGIPYIGLCFAQGNFGESDSRKTCNIFKKSFFHCFKGSLLRLMVVFMVSVFHCV